MLKETSITVKPSKIFIIENNIIIEILDKATKPKYIYIPRKLTPNQLETNVPDKSFYYHYINDKHLLGINGERHTEKLVISIKLGLKLNSINYYIDDRTHTIYEYKANNLYPLVISNHNNSIDYYIVNLSFQSEEI